MNRDAIDAMVRTRGAGDPAVRRQVATLATDDPIRVRVEEEIAATLAAHDAAAQRRAEASAARNQAGQGSLIERIAAMETRIAALEDGV